MIHYGNLYLHLAGEMVGEGGFILEEEVLGEDLPVEIEPPTTSEFFQSLLPMDNLLEPLKDSPSNLLQKMMDLQRERTPANADDGTDFEDFLTQHERFILEQVRSKATSQESGRTYESEESTEALRRHIAAEFKSIVYEMSAQSDGVDAVTPVSSGEQIKEDSIVLSEYLRHTRELGSLSYSQQQMQLDKTQQIVSNLDSAITSTRSIHGNFKKAV